MTIHEASNVASKILGEYLVLLSKIEAQGGQRVTNTINQVEEARRVLDNEYPPPLGISVIENIKFKEILG